MKTLVFITLFFVVLELFAKSTASPTQTQELCEKVMVIDCEKRYQTSENEELCGSDGKTYLNKCYFVQAKCKDIGLEQVKLGKCTSDSNSNDSYLGENNSVRRTTKLAAVVPETKIHTTPHGGGSGTNLFCNNDSQCPNTLDPLCGNDGVFYLNICEFQKAKCKNNTLTILPSLSLCEGNST